MDQCSPALLSFAAFLFERVAGMIEEGKAVPLFTLKDSSGYKVALKDFRGRNVIVYFHPGDDTPDCTKEACGFRDMMCGKKTTGVIRSTIWIGPTGRVVKHWRRVAKAADHPAKVLEALQAGS